MDFYFRICRDTPSLIFKYRLHKPIIFRPRRGQNIAVESKSQACRCPKKMPNFKNVSHVIFDLDGLLIDTEIKYTQIANEICKPYGKELNWELKERIMGVLGREASEVMVSALDLPISSEEYFRKARELHKKYMQQTEFLPDTEFLYFNIYTTIAARYEKKYGWETYMKLMGTKEQDSARTVIEELQLPMTVDEFVSEQYKAQKILFPQVQLMPGAERLVRHFHENSIPIAVATSSALESVELKTAHHSEVMHLFHHIVSASSDQEVERGKPAPDVFLVCASRFDDCPDPSKCLVFEDAPNGVTAARAAGMQVVMVPDHRVSEELRKHATFVIPSLEHFKPEMFGLPPFKQ